jgi:hypothetical protein
VLFGTANLKTLVSEKRERVERGEEGEERERVERRGEGRGGENIGTRHVSLLFIFNHYTITNYKFKITNYKI